MAVKQNSAASRSDEPVEVFRQFAWHLAGSLAAGRVGKATGAGKSPAAKGAGKR